MSFSPGTAAPQSGIYWCSVCKTPAQFKAGESFPPAGICAAAADGNLCRRKNPAGSNAETALAQVSAALRHQRHDPHRRAGAIFQLHRQHHGHRSRWRNLPGISHIFQVIDVPGGAEAMHLILP